MRNGMTPKNHPTELISFKGPKPKFIPFLIPIAPGFIPSTPRFIPGLFLRGLSFLVVCGVLSTHPCDAKEKESL